MPLSLSRDTARALRAELPRVGDRVVTAIVQEVPEYSRAFAGPMGQTIREAVQIALGTFLDGLTRARPRDDSPAHAGAYELGRGEARSGRSADALLAAYRVGARVAWRELAAVTVAVGLTAEELAGFAEDVFAYIDELSAASVAGHTDELETTGRVRQRMRERLARLLLTGAAEETLLSAADRADWAPPAQLTAVLVRPAETRRVQTDLGVGDARVLVAGDDLLAQIPTLAHLAAAGPDQRVLLLVSDLRPATVVRRARQRDALVGPAVEWTRASASVDRLVRALAVGVNAGGGAVDTADHLAAMVTRADPEALAELRARALAPLADLSATSRAKLEETLRAWLLLRGRRDEVAAALFVHPQTVRYRVGQLRELFGEALDEPDVVRDLVIALG